MVAMLILIFLQAVYEVKPVTSFLLAAFDSFPKHMFIFAQDHYNIPQVGDFQTCVA